MEWLRAQLEDVRENPRLRMGLWVVLGIASFYLVLLVSDRREATRAESRQLAERIARLERAAEQGDWQIRAENARARLISMEQGFWNSSSRGLAQAEFESWLLQQAEQSGLGRAKATTDSPVSAGDTSGLWTVTTQLDVEFEPRPLYRFLRSVEGHDKLVVVSRLAVGERGSDRASLTLSGYYRIDDA